MGRPSAVALLLLGAAAGLPTAVQAAPAQVSQTQVSQGQLAPAIAARVAPGGRVALSGVLETQAAQVIEAWAPFITLHVGATHEGWIRLEGQRPTA